MTSSLLNELNQKQREAVEHQGAPLLILAGAGSGKTRTLTYKAAHFVASGLTTPDTLLLVTFTNKAAGEMRERIERFVDVAFPHVGTFHSIAASILRKDGRHIGIAHHFTIYDQQDQLALVKELLGEQAVDQQRFRPGGVLSGISSAKQELLNPDTYSAIAKGPYQEVVAALYPLYQQRLRTYGALDFDDLLFEVVRLFREQSSILSSYQRRFAHVFVDEYQDTNASQYMFTKLLAQKHRNLTVVGDASQSIYRWRGADFRNISRLKEDFPELVEMRLEQNYRSTQTILNAADSVIARNTTHPVLSLWTESGVGEHVGLLEASSGYEEAARILDIIATRRSQESRSWSDFAILYRTNAQSRVFEEFFVRAGIPYTLVGGIKFYERAEVKDVLAYLRLVHNPKDGVSRSRAEKLGKRRLSTFVNALSDFDTTSRSVSDMLAFIYEKTGYLSRYNEDVEEDLARLENIRELDSLAQEFTDLGDFLEHVALVQNEYYEGEVGSIKDSVTLMTMHAAKGLEFPVVFMVGMEEGLFPHSRSMLEKDALEEERRLCYVGITRAKEKLYLSYARRRLLYGSQVSNVRSRFIDEVESSLFDVEKETDVSQKRSKSGIRIDALSDATLESFLSGEMSVEELLDR